MGKVWAKKGEWLTILIARLCNLKSLFNKKKKSIGSGREFEIFKRASGYLYIFETKTNQGITLIWSQELD